MNARFLFPRLIFFIFVALAAVALGFSGAMAGIPASMSASIVVDPTSGLVTDENGGSATFTIVLGARPTNPVNIPLSSSNPTEGSVSPSIVHLTPGNWDIPQTVTVTGAADGIPDGDIAYTIITAPAVSGDPAYNGLNAADVSVTNLDDAIPVANPDSAQTTEDAPVVIDVLVNDSGLDDAPVGVGIASAPPHGTAVVIEGNLVRYTPAPNYNGADNFQYIVCDVDGDCAQANVSVTITPLNDAPTAIDDAAATSLNTPVTVDVLANDLDVDGDTILLASFSATSANGGTVTRQEGGTPADLSDDQLSYQPPAGFSGDDTFGYTASDGKLSDSAMVTVTVAPNQQEPVALDDSYTTPQDTPLSVDAASGVLANDLDPNGGGLSAELLSSTSHGILHLLADGSFTYTPATGFYGLDSFTYQAFDGVAYSNTATATITVLNPNHAPVAVGENYTTGQFDALSVEAPGVLANDSDPDGDPLQATLKAAPLHGTLLLNANGSFTYTPEGSFVGVDTFTYQASDGRLASKPASVRITLRDQIKPVVTWVSPISSDNTFDTIGGTLRLEVEATDNISVERVRFYWWDAIAKIYVELGNVATPPYRVDVNVATFHLYWNQISAIARDTAGNQSNPAPLFIYVTPTVYLPLISR